MCIALESQIGRNIEAYIDDLFVKTKDQVTLIGDLAETSDNLRRMRMKLNPENYVFGVRAFREAPRLPRLEQGHRSQLREDQHH